MSYRISGLAPESFAPLFALSEAALRARNMRRVLIDAPHAAPCRVSLDDAAPGEEVLLLNHMHQGAQTPYRQQGPIFVSAARERCDATGAVPPALSRRPLSLRGYDAEHMMIDADLADGAQAQALIERLFANPDIAYIHAHYARRGCYAALIERA